MRRILTSILLVLLLLTGCTMIGKVISHEEERHFASNFEDYWAENMEARMGEYIDEKRDEVNGWLAAFFGTGGIGAAWFGRSMIKRRKK